MRPKDLKPTFSWKDREILLKDRILYVPDYLDDYQTFQFPGWEHEDVFGNTNPVHVEYCSGNGAWIATKAMEHPEINWVAVEIRFDRVRKIWSKLKNHKLNNLFVVCGDATIVTPHYFPKGSVQQVYINFPDPWPKTKHAKHRLIKDSFIKDVTAVMEKQAALTFVTDDPDYSTEAQGVIRPHFKILDYKTENPGYGTSYFEKLWRDKGKMIRYHNFSL